MDYYKYVETTNFNETNDAGPVQKKGEDIFKRIANYQNAYDGNSGTTVLYDPSSTKQKVSPPLGRSYFYETDIRCNNYPNQKRHIFIDAKTSSQKNILAAATADINNIKNLSNDPKPTVCVKKTYTAVGVNGKRKSESQYVGKETFVLPSLGKMDAGQQLFIGSFAVLGLFLFYKVLCKK